MAGPVQWYSDAYLPLPCLILRAVHIAKECQALKKPLKHGQEDSSHRKSSVRSRSILPIESILEREVNIPWILLTQAVVASLMLDLVFLYLPPHGMRLILHLGTW